MSRELVYCRTCKRRHVLRGWRQPDGVFSGWLRDDSAYCPTRKVRYISMRHERTGKPMPI